MLKTLLRIIGHVNKNDEFQSVTQQLSFLEKKTRHLHDDCYAFPLQKRLYLYFLNSYLYETFWKCSSRDDITPYTFSHKYTFYIRKYLYIIFFFPKSPYKKNSIFLVSVPRYFILSHEPSTAYGPSRPLCPWCQTQCISTAP